METANSNPTFSASIHEIEWERIKLKLYGLVEGSNVQESSFYLCNYSDDLLIPLKNVSFEGHSFKIVINITTIFNKDRLPNGKWDLLIVSKNNTRKVGIARNLIRGNALDEVYSRNFKSGAKRVYKFHLLLNNKENNLYFDVYFKCPQPKKRRKITFKRRIANFREQLFVTIFNLSKKIVKKNGKRVLFTSASRSKIGGNLGAVYNRMIERNLDKEYKLYKVFKTNIWARSKWWDKFKLPFYLGIADYIFIEDYQPMVNSLEYDEDTEIVQLWHANGAFKTFGYSRLGKPASPKIDGENHRIYTKAIVSSKHVIPYYAEAFAIEEDNVIATGIPKTDIFFDEGYRKETIKKLKNLYPQVKNADKVILFGPTFRGGGPKTAYYPMKKINMESLAQFCRNNNAVVIFKMHFLVKNSLAIPDEYSDVLIDATDYREINDILFIADVLITDYSSTIYEYSLLNRPMLFYAFDLEEYIASRDFYDEFTGFVPGKIVKSFDELLGSLENEDYEFEKVEIFRKKNFEFLHGGAADRVIDWIILRKEKSMPATNNINTNTNGITHENIGSTD